MNSRGQVTAFIILGIVLLAVFVMSFYLVSTLTADKLDVQKEKVFASALSSQVFSFAGQQCIQSALEDGLKKLGQQGFYLDLSQDALGNVSDVAVLVGPSVQELADLPKYPCVKGVGPYFCRYPQIGSWVKFGSVAVPPIDSGYLSIKRQLADFMVEEIRNCTSFDETLSSEGFAGVEIIQEDPVVELSFGESVAARVKLPLSIKVGGVEPIIHLTEWSAQAGVRLKDLRNLVKYVLQQDVIDLNFNLSDYSLDGYSFLRATGVVLNPPEFLGPHQLFVFNDTRSWINNSNFVLRFVRRNRPPALDFIGFRSSPFYDVLLVEGESWSPSLSGGDPDEQVPVFSSDFPSRVNLDQPGLYNFTAWASDSFLEDWQNVSVLVDHNLSDVFVGFNVSSIFPGFVRPSIEDPFVLNVSYFNTSLAPVSYSYDFMVDTGSGVVSISSGYHCSVWPTLSNCSSRNFGSLPGSLSFDAPGLKTFRLDISWIYPSSDSSSDSFEQSISHVYSSVDFDQCTPFRNPVHPWSFPYHDLNLFGDVEEIDPLFSSHVCCLDSGQFASTGVVCGYNVSLPVDEFCSPESNYYLLSRTAVYRNCSGSRGNVCDGLVWQGTLETGLCGDNSYETGCRPPNYPLTIPYIKEECQRQRPYSIIENEGWCYGSEGCADFCHGGKAVVDMDSKTFPGEQLLVLDSSFRCGCQGRNLMPCDSNFDGFFNGICGSGGCVES